MIRKILSEIRSSARSFPRTFRSKLKRPSDIAKYLAATKSPKLHIGCGPHKLTGWLNTDIDTSKGAVYLDATKPLPFPDDSFDFIFSEHMIEHIPIAAAQKLCSECARILRPGGVLRLATPDMACLFVIWSQSDSAPMRAYISNAEKHFVNYPNVLNKCLAINNFFYNWGHQFIYDEETLVRLMENGGFDEVQRTKVSESSHASLKGLERHALSIGEKFNTFETMVIEGRKPPIS
jgi:predicted SAM-dependent methyltransferase